MRRLRVIGVVCVLVSAALVCGERTGAHAVRARVLPPRSSSVVVRRTALAVAVAGALRFHRYGASRVSAVSPSMSCYTYRHTDPSGDTAGGIDAVGDTLDYDCVHHLWTVAFTAAQPFADNQLVLFAADLDTDGNLTDNCHGADYSVAVGWVPSTGALVARLFQWVNGCTTGTGEPLTIERQSAHSIAVTFADTDIGSPPVMRWYDSVTGTANATGNQWDYMPNAGEYTATKTTSAAFVDQSPPTINGHYTQIVSGDFNGDGHEDLLFYAAGTQPDYAWFGRANGTYVSRQVTINGSYDILPGDFNGDGTTDLLFYGRGLLPDSLWIAHHDGNFTSAAVTINGSYDIVSGDFNGDGATDLFFYAPGPAPGYMWTGTPEGTFHHVATPFAINNRYDITAADLNGDGRTDLVLYAPGPAPSVLWLGQTNDTFVASSLTINGNYAIVRAGDFNGDGADDLLLFNPDTGADAMLYGSSTAPYARPGPATVIDERYADAIVGDFNGDGTSDVLFYGPGAIPERLWVGVRVPAVALPTSGVGSIVVDAMFGRVYMTGGPTDDQLLEFDLHGNLLSDITGLSGADGMLLTTSTLYVALSGAGQIAEFSHYSLTRTGTIDTSSIVTQPSSVAITGGKLWFGSEGTQDSGSYDLTSHTIAATGIGITDSPWVYASDDVPDRLFVFGRGNDHYVTEYDVSGASPTWVGATPSGGFCFQAIIAPGTTNLYTACWDLFSEHDATTPDTGGTSYSAGGTIAEDVTAANGGWVLAARNGLYESDVLAFRPGNPQPVHQYETSCFTGCAVAIAPDGRTADVVVRTQAQHVQLQIIRLH